MISALNDQINEGVLLSTGTTNSLGHCIAMLELINFLGGGTNTEKTKKRFIYAGVLFFTLVGGAAAHAVPFSIYYRIIFSARTLSKELCRLTQHSHR